MLAELNLLRALQRAQAEALDGGDLERLEALHRERLSLQAGLDRRALGALTPPDRARAEALVAEIAREQRSLSRRAGAAAEALGRELRGLGAGRSALSGYRPAAGAASLLLDRSG